MLLNGCSKKIAPQVIDITPPVVNVIDTAVQLQQPVSVDITPYLQADWTSFKSGGNAHFTMGSKSMGSSMQMRMQRGKSIYVSIRPVLGIEAAKMVIHNDSVMLVDKLHKRYILEKASLLTNGVPVTVETLQDIFLGRAFSLGKGSLTQSLKDDFSAEQQPDGKVILKPREQFKGYTYIFTYDSNKNILALDVTPVKDGTSICNVAYSDVQGSVAGKVASKVNVSTKIHGSGLKIDLEYSGMKWNEKFDIDTKSPKNYKRVDAKDISSFFSGK